MGRAGRYTLSVMAWVAAYAGWSSIIGLVVAALTGDRPRAVSPGVSALLTVIGPLVPTLVALWFNDWARDGFPSREQQRAAKARGTDVAAPASPESAPSESAPPEAEAVAAPAGQRAPVPPAGPGVVDDGAADHDAAWPRVMAPAADADAPAPRTVAAHPLGLPAAPAAQVPAGSFPVAPLLRDGD